MVYDWKAALAFFATLVVLTTVGRRLVFLVPAYQEMRRLNRETDRTKLAKARFKKSVKASNQAGLYSNLAFYVTVLPFSISLESRPFWQYVLHIVAVLMIFDFFYYLTHRFLFHGKALRKVHSLHHQALKPTYIDALYFTVTSLTTNDDTPALGGTIDDAAATISATVDGQTTAHYLSDRLDHLPVTVTRLAQGVPMGGELDHLDEGTLTAALMSRRGLD